MGYKFKPNKSVAKRFKVTRNGKVKRHHGFTSHLRSARSSAKKRHLRGSAILYEGHARNMRRLMGISKSPGKIATAKREKAAAQAAVAEAAK